MSSDPESVEGVEGVEGIASGKEDTKSPKKAARARGNLFDLVSGEYRAAFPVFPNF